MAEGLSFTEELEKERARTIDELVADGHWIGTLMERDLLLSEAEMAYRDNQNDPSSVYVTFYEEYLEIARDPVAIASILDKRARNAAYDFGYEPDAHYDQTSPN